MDRVSVVTPLLLGFVLVREFIEDAQTPYGDYPAWMLGVFRMGQRGGYCADRLRRRSHPMAAEHPGSAAGTRHSERSRAS